MRTHTRFWIPLALALSTALVTVALADDSSTEASPPATTNDHPHWHHHHHGDHQKGPLGEAMRSAFAKCGVSKPAEGDKTAWKAQKTAREACAKQIAAYLGGFTYTPPAAPPGQ